MNNKITSLTRRDISNLFINGLDIDFLLGDTTHVIYPYSGSLTEIDFLNRLYNLKEMKSEDSRFENAEDEIRQHTINNNDYELGWVFKDDRFRLINGDDEHLLKFLCELFHPLVRDEKGYWEDYLKEVNRLLANDDIELYPIKKISNHDVYGWRLISQNKNMYVPFSQRNKDDIDSSKLKITLKVECRRQLLNIFRMFDEELNLTNETGLNYTANITQQVFGEISLFYEPFCYNESGKYVKADTFDNFVSKSRPYCVFDAIEIFSKKCTDKDYSERVNALLIQYKIPYALNCGLLSDSQDIGIDDEQIGSAPEIGVTELLQKAQSYFNQGSKQEAVEKLWDAFERIKTIYTDCDKKHSAEIIIDTISKGASYYKEIFNSESLKLTDIGNKFRIRHHETDKIEIDDERYYDYFFYRCNAFISLIINFKVI